MGTLAGNGLMTLNWVKLGRAVTFIIEIYEIPCYIFKFSLIFLPKNLIWNKIAFPASNLLYFTKLVENELMKNIF